MSDYTPPIEQVRQLYANSMDPAGFDRMIAQVRAETVEYVAQIATDTLRMCQAGGVGEKNILPLQQEVGFQLCIDNIANLAKSMKGEGQ